MTIVEDVVTQVLREGLDDWVPLDVLLWYARRLSPSPGDSFKEVAIAALKFLLNEQLVMVGDIGETGFERWECTAEESVNRIVTECEALSWKPLGGICWISNTPSGDDLASNAALN